MKALVIRANPRKIGHTENLTNLFIEGMQQAGAEVEQVYLTTKKINYCTGCYNCWLVTPGQCVQDDDMAEVMMRDHDRTSASEPESSFPLDEYLPF